MRFNVTPGFAALQGKVDLAINAHDRAFDEDSNSKRTEGAIKDLNDAVWEMIAHDAFTPSEIRKKISAIKTFEVDSWIGSDNGGVFDTLMNDMQRLASIPVSPAMRDLVTEWRHLDLEFVVNHHDDTDEVADARLAKASSAYHAIMRAACTTPGDFMVKCYLNLLGEIGTTYRHDDPSSNVFDIEIELADSTLDQNEEWQRSAYEDLDQSDIGANLLAYGLPFFSAENWLKRADAVGLTVHVIIDGDNKSIWIADADFVGAYDRIAREQDRLRRIFAFDRVARASLIGEEFERDRPQRILRTGSSIENAP